MYNNKQAWYKLYSIILFVSCCKPIIIPACQQHYKGTMQRLSMGFLVFTWNSIIIGGREIVPKQPRLVSKTQEGVIVFLVLIVY